MVWVLSRVYPPNPSANQDGVWGFVQPLSLEPRHLLGHTDIFWATPRVCLVAPRYDGIS